MPSDEDALYEVVEEFDTTALNEDFVFGDDLSAEPIKESYLKRVENSDE